MSTKKTVEESKQRTPQVLTRSSKPGDFVTHQGANGKVIDRIKDGFLVSFQGGPVKPVMV